MRERQPVASGRLVVWEMVRKSANGSRGVSCGMGGGTCFKNSIIRVMPKMLFETSAAVTVDYRDTGPNKTLDVARLSFLKRLR